MPQVLSDVRSVGGVVGCFIFDPKAGVVAADAPALFKPAKLMEVGRALAKTMKAAKMALPDGADVSFYYEEILIVSRDLGKGALLVVLCDPSMNVNLLSMSLNLAMEELQELAQRSSQSAAQEKAASAPPSPPPPPPPPAQKAAPAPSPKAAPKAHDAGHSPSLDEETMRALEGALAKVVGPMALIIFRDSYEVWRARGDAHTGGLVSVVCEEIGDEAKADRFRALAANLIMREGDADE